MPIFRYRGYDSRGSGVAGTIEAENRSEALEKVRRKGVFPKEVASESRKKSFLSKLGPDFLAWTTRQLSILLASGVPLVEALRSLAEEQNRARKAELLRLAERVSEGAGLSRAMEESAEVFPEFYRNMISAGEAGGSLATILDNLADFLETQQVIKAKVSAALRYPAFLILLSLAVMVALFSFVIPKILRIFEDAEASLPLLTRVLVWTSDFFVEWRWPLAVAAVAAVLLLRWLYRTRRRLIDRFLLSLPGGLFQSLYYLRFTRTLGFLLSGGLPMLRALELSGRATGNRELERRIGEGQKRVAEGGTLAASIEGLPGVLRQLIATGEKGGRIVEVLEKAARAYEEEFDRKVRGALDLLGPVVTLILGVVVAMIVFGVLLPMFELNQLIKL